MSPLLYYRDKEQVAQKLLSVRGSIKGSRSIEAIFVRVRLAKKTRTAPNAVPFSKNCAENFLSYSSNLPKASYF
jgi:hypothetical protein